jgi:hypothetical protein
MAIKTLAELKSKFETGDQPTAQDFIDFMDSFLHAGLGNFPNPLPAVSGADLENIGDALPNPLPARDGSALTNINPKEYNVPGSMPVPSYATANTFVLTGDFTIGATDPNNRIFLIARRLRIQIAGAYEYTEVSNAVFAAGITTATTLDAMSGSPIQEVAVGVITPFALGGAAGPRTVGSADDTKVLHNTGNETAAGNKTLTGTATLSGPVYMGDIISITGDISPAQITADQNDYNPTGLSTASVLRLNTDALRYLSGIASGTDGKILTLINVGNFTIGLKHNALSTAANRFYLDTAAVYILPNSSLMICYDATSSRWRPINLISLSGWLPIAKKSANNSSPNLDFTGFLSGSFQDYRLVIDNIRAGTAGTSIYGRVGNGGVFDAAGSHYVSTASSDPSPQNQFLITDSTSGIRASAADSGVSVTIIFHNPSDNTRHKHLEYQVAFYDNAGVYRGQSGAMFYVSSNAFTDFRILNSSVNLTDGDAYLYALKPSQ